ncbi:hypothetical protein BC835DRAFT_1407505 [Cytidiella melzeri]|nr:hypothetical protein BC835DRAFT_1407505 [Cytidiella melzeri]
MYRAVFKFGVFNAVQSTCFDKVMKGDDNLKSAPTGSGKTAVFELAIIRMLNQSHTSGRQLKCIYVSPTKALCSERYRDWVTKFQPLGINCCELTGDTVKFGKSAWGDARHASIIVTTGEKWDSLTRNWDEHEHILSQVQLFLVDEVHILNESRGSTLEVIVSRMKTRGTCVRFVMVSATVPNIHDVARWIGNNPHGGPAVVMEFGEEYRPCILTRHVYGVHRKKDQNDFVFSKSLDYKLYGILKQHSVDKPVLVFCATRRGVMGTAEQLMKEYEESTTQKDLMPWSRPRRIEATFHDKRLEKLATCGIGIHHAGMSFDDRRATEDLYLKKILRVVVATSTLAVGVNLPAHTVVIKGVNIFQNNTSKEYSDLDIMQMIGRAGRPQFDKEGVAIIMCEADLKQKYEALAQGRTLLESSLHLNLAEHINSEIGLNTIRDVQSAKEWLHNSFLFQRIQQNPRHYAIGKAGDQTWQERVGEMVTESIEKLQKNQLVQFSDEDGTVLTSTEYGDIMSKIYNKLRAHDDIRYKPKKIEKAHDKISVIIQAVLAGISLNDPEYKSGDNQPAIESLTIFRHIERITRAMLEVALAKQSGAQIKYGMELLRCLHAKAWEDRPVLAEHSIASLTDLRKQDPLRIETLLNRRPPFGHEVLAYVKQLPQYKVVITETNVTPSDGKSPVEVELVIQCGLLHELADAPQPKKGKSHFREATMVVTVTSDLDYVDFRRISTKSLRNPKSFSVVAKLTKPSQTVLAQAMEGVDMNAEFWAGMAEGLSESGDDIPLKDLTTCRHLCCHEGLPKPPPLTKKRVETLYPTTQDTGKKPAAIKARPKELKGKSKVQDKPDRRIQQLEDLHTRNGVESSIQLPEGRRIKLDDGSLHNKVGVPKPARQKLKANFDMEFTDVDAGDTLDWGIPEIAPLSDDDMPDAQDILAQRSKNRSKKTQNASDAMYDDSEVDDMTRKVPTPPPIEVLDLEQLQGREDLPFPISGSASESNDGEPTVDNTPESSSSTHFIGPCVDDDFEIDDSNFEITPSVDVRSSTHSQSAAKKSEYVVPYLLRPDSHLRQPASDVKLQCSVPGSAFKTTESAQEAALLPPNEHSAPEDAFEDDWADLEAWLNSDAVVIVDHLD